MRRQFLERKGQITKARVAVAQLTCIRMDGRIQEDDERFSAYLIMFTEQRDRMADDIKMKPAKVGVYRWSLAR